MNELDAIAKEAAETIHNCRIQTVVWTEDTIRAAIDKALEVVVPGVVEKCAAVCNHEARNAWEIHKDLDAKYAMDACAMSIRKLKAAALLETLKGNSSVTQAGNHPSATP